MNQQLVFTCSCTELSLEMPHLHGEVQERGPSSAGELYPGELYPLCGKKDRSPVKAESSLALGNLQGRFRHLHFKGQHFIRLKGSMHSC